MILDFVDLWMIMMKVLVMANGEPGRMYDDVW